jgi:hypothetical protein
MARASPKASFSIKHLHHLNTIDLQSPISNLPIFTQQSSLSNTFKSANMVSFTTSTISVALVAVLTMVQPIAANGGFSFAPSVHILRARDAPASSTTSPGARPTGSHHNLEFSACQQAAAAIVPKPTYIIYTNRTVDINGLPAVCISQLNAHNAKENIAQTNKWEGWGIVLNSTAIQVSLTL